MKLSRAVNDKFEPIKNTTAKAGELSDSQAKNLYNKQQKGKVWFSRVVVVKTGEGQYRIAKFTFLERIINGFKSCLKKDKDPHFSALVKKRMSTSENKTFTLLDKIPIGSTAGKTNTVANKKLASKPGKPITQPKPAKQESPDPKKLANVYKDLQAKLKKDPASVPLDQVKNYIKFAKKLTAEEEFPDPTDQKVAELMTLCLGQLSRRDVKGGTEIVTEMASWLTTHYPKPQEDYSTIEGIRTTLELCTKTDRPIKVPSSLKQGEKVDTLGRGFFEYFLLSLPHSALVFITDKTCPPTKGPEKGLWGNTFSLLLHCKEVIKLIESEEPFNKRTYREFYNLTAENQLKYADFLESLGCNLEEIHTDLDSDGDGLTVAKKVEQAKLDEQIVHLAMDQEVPWSDDEEDTFT